MLNFVSCHDPVVNTFAELCFPRHFVKPFLVDNPPASRITSVCITRIFSNVIGRDKSVSRVKIALARLDEFIKLSSCSLWINWRRSTSVQSFARTDIRIRV